MEDLLEATRAATALAMLTGALVLDFRSRRVPNRYWFPFIGAAAAAWAVQLGGWRAGDALLPFAVACVLAAAFYALFYTGLYGGADAKGLMVMAFLVPTLPDSPLPLPPALLAMMAGTVAVLAYPVLLAVVNLARGSVRLPAMLLGIEMDIGAARARHVWPMQAVRPEGGLEWRYWRFIGRDFEATYDALAAAGVRRVWVTPKVPFLAFVWAGYLVVLALGDPLAWLAARLA